MGDVDERDAELLLQALEEELHLLAQLQVERAEGLVEEQHLRPVHERAGERDALALAARKLARPAVADSRQAHRLQHVVDSRSALRAVDALHAQAVGDVVGHAHVRKERVVLEDGVEIPRVRRPVGDVGAAELDPALVRALEARDQPQRRRLARAGRPEHREELTGTDLELDAVDGDDVAVRLAHSGQPDSCRPREGVDGPLLGDVLPQ